MGLIRRERFVSPITSRYSVTGLQQKYLIVGLGNPGDEYDLTRHNAGFSVVEYLADQAGVGWSNKKDWKALESSTTIAGKDVVLLKPQTFMNLSGEAVQAAASFYKIPDKQILVIHDELDLNFGDVRLKDGGGHAGHNGLKDIIRHIGGEFARIRIGIGPKYPEQIDSADFVLQKFSKEEQKKLPEIISLASTTTRNFLKAT